MDSELKAFDAMGSGSGMRACCKMCCSLKGMWRNMVKNEMVSTSTGETLELTEQNMKGEGFLLGGTWIVAHKGQGDSREGNDYALVHHHQAVDMMSDVPETETVLSALGIAALEPVEDEEEPEPELGVSVQEEELSEGAGAMSPSAASLPGVPSPG